MYTQYPRPREFTPLYRSEWQIRRPGPMVRSTMDSPNADPRAPRKYTFGVIVSLIAIALFLALFVTDAVLLLVKAVSGTG